MKKFAFILSLILFAFSVKAQDNININFFNDYKDVYHLSLIIYTPDGKIQTRVSNLNPAETKTYSLPARTEIFIADYKQEEFAMKGNDIKASGVKPFIVLKDSDSEVLINLSSIANPQMSSNYHRLENISKEQLEGNPLGNINCFFYFQLRSNQIRLYRWLE